jgi:hypothetical protein
MYQENSPMRVKAPVCFSVILCSFLLLFSVDASQGGGCGFSVPIFNAKAGEKDGGAMLLQGTPFDGKGFPGPEIRFWAYHNFAEANSGTQAQFQSLDNAWLANLNVDFKMKTTKPYAWVLAQANWLGMNIDGCIRTLKDEPQRDRCVVEVSFPDGAKENSAAHQSYYLIMSVPFSNGLSAFNFDDVRGGEGPAGNQVKAVPVPVPALSHPAGKRNGKDKAFMDVSLVIPDAVSYSEKGLNEPVNLIKGYRILYVLDKEPVSSDPKAYQEVLSPESPKKPLGLIPYKAGKVTVTVPTPKKAAWFVAQIVYDDPTREVLSRGTSGSSKPVRPPAD